MTNICMKYGGAAEGDLGWGGGVAGEVGEGLVGAALCSVWGGQYAEILPGVAVARCTAAVQAKQSFQLGC